MDSLRAWTRDHTLAVDAMVAVAFFALGLLAIRLAYDVNLTLPHRFRFAAGVACMALLTLPLAFRRRYPPVSLIGLTLGILGYTVFGVSEGATSGTAGFLAIYSVGAYCRRRLANWVRGVCISIVFLALLWTLLFREVDLNHSKASVIGAGLLVIFSNVFFFIAAWVIGDVARTAKTRAAELADRNVEIQAAQDVIAEQAVLDERVHIAREVHDVVAHHVSVMGVQAGAARRVMARDPAKATEMLSAIEASSRQAVGELHRLLGFLRRDSAPEGGAGGTAVAGPQPGLTRLDALVEEMNEAGLAVSSVTEGTVRPVPPSVDLSAYRVAQEALTNALKHAGAGTTAVVTLRYATDHLELSIVDDGRGRANGRTDHRAPDPKPSSGHGLVGMRERVALSGGQFEASRTRGSGFAVKAIFPLAAAFQSTS
jgi:signal transduction histidine kinase